MPSAAPATPAALEGRPGEYVSWTEVTRSSTAAKLGIPNELTAAAKDNVVWLATSVFDPLRRAIGRPLKVSSWYRSAKVNKAIRGASTTSRHLTGEAVDVMADGLTAKQLAALVLALGLPFDQLIGYGDAPHLHIGRRREGDRQQVLWYPTHGSKSQPWSVQPATTLPGGQPIVRVST